MKCPNALVSCTLKCGYNLRRDEMSNHVSNDCTKRHVTCTHCQGNFPFDGLEVRSRGLVPGYTDNSLLVLCMGLYCIVLQTSLLHVTCIIHCKYLLTVMKSYTHCAHSNVTSACNSSDVIVSIYRCKNVWYVYTMYAESFHGMS